MAIPCSSSSGSGSGIGGCTSPCSCVVADDGIKVIGESYVVNTGEGRRNTVVSGQGTAADPYTVSFIDSEFYRPDAGEFTYPNQVEDSSLTQTGTLLDFIDGPGVVVYQQLGTIFFNISLGDSGDFSVKGFFQIVGASVEFTGNTTGTRKILIMYDDGTNARMIAGNVSDAPTENLTLSASGFYPGRFSQSPDGVHPVGFSLFTVRVYQDSGNSLAVSNLKFWVGTL